MFNSESELDEGVNKTCKEILTSGPKAVSACKALLRNISQVFPNLEILFNNTLDGLESPIYKSLCFQRNS